MTRRIPAAFALSGAAAAAFETLWFHQAGLAFGNSVLASSVVLSGFMAGLALGSAIALRFGDGVRHPVRAFAALEVIVAASGVALVLGLPRLTVAFAPALEGLDAPSALAARFALAFTLLALPTTAMGLALPMLVRALANPTLGYAPSLGRLYGWNTLGAVAGVVLAETLAIEAFGIRGAALLAATANLGAAALLWPNRLDTAATEEPEEASASTRPSGAVLAAAVGAFLAGFAMLALEVVGFRFLSLFVMTRDEAFAWMLATVLAGIGLGSLGGEWALRRGVERARSAPALAFLIGIAIAGAYRGFPALTDPATHKVGDAWSVLALSLPLLLPAALASGALFPWIGAALRRPLGASARTTGALGMANTLGAAAGAVSAAFLWLPALGMEKSFFGLAVLCGIAGLLLLPLCGFTRASGVTAAGWLLALLFFPFGVLEDRHLARALEIYDVPSDAEIEVREGIDQTLVWIETPLLGRPYTHRLVTDGYSMSATDVQARRYMKLYVVLPAALHSELRRGLLVSYGVGSTARALADVESFEHIDVVDISREILELGARAFAPERNPLADPRVRVHIEDGRYFLESAEARYDLITGEPPPPMLAGIVKLYTREYFSLVRRRLNEGGYFTTWLPLRQMSDAGALAIVSAFCEAFPDCSLWRGQSFDLMLMGSNEAKGAPSESHFTRQWRDPRTRPELEAIGLERPEQLGALFIADAEQLRAFIANTPPLTDDRPRRITAGVTSVEAQHALYGDWLDPNAGRARFSRSAFAGDRWPPAQRRGALQLFDLGHLLDTFGQDIRSDRWSERFLDLRAVLGSGMARTPVLWLLGSDADAQAIVSQADPVERETPEALWHRAVGLVADRRLDAALPLLRRAAHTPEVFERAVALELFLRCALNQQELTAVRARVALPKLDPGPRRDDLAGFLADVCGVDVPLP